MFFVAPITFRERDARVSKLIRAGSATDDQLFEAQYGQWPANGLNKDTERPDIVNFKGYFSGSRSVLGAPFTMAYADPNDPDRDIHINRMTMNPAAPIMGLLTTRMAYARIHDLLEPILGVELGRLGILFLAASFASSYRYAVVSSFSKLLRASTADIIGEEHIHVMQFKDGNDLTARRAFLNDGKNISANATGLRATFNTLGQVFDTLLTMMPREHYAQDHELQARIHNLMVRGYKSWGRLPANESELYAALYDMGIRHPNVIKTYLADDGCINVRDVFMKKAKTSFNDDGTTRKVKLTASQTGFVAPPAGEMNMGLNYFRNSEVILRFWKDYLPMIYGDLLVKYGDSAGMQRMGYSDELDIMGLPIKAKKLEGPKAP